MLFVPLPDQGHVNATDHRAKVDRATLIKKLVDVHYPGKRKIVLAMDNLTRTNYPRYMRLLSQPKHIA